MGQHSILATQKDETANSATQTISDADAYNEVVELTRQAIAEADDELLQEVGFESTESKHVGGSDGIRLYILSDEDLFGAGADGGQEATFKKSWKGISLLLDHGEAQKVAKLGAQGAGAVTGYLNKLPGVPGLVATLVGSYIAIQSARILAKDKGKGVVLTLSTLALASMQWWAFNVKSR